MSKKKLLCMLLVGCMSLGAGALSACGEDTPANGGNGGNDGVKIEYALSEVEVKVKVGETFALELLSSADEITETPVWNTENAKIAKVSQEGVITGIALGKTRITVEIGGTTIAALVEVVEILSAVPQILLEGEFAGENGYEFTLLVGESYELTPVLVADSKIDGVSFTVTSAATSVAVSGTTLTGAAVATDVEITLSCTYQGENYEITATVDVVEEA